MTQDEHFFESGRATPASTPASRAAPLSAREEYGERSDDTLIDEDELDHEGAPEQGDRFVRIRSSLFTVGLTLGSLLILLLIAGNVYQLLQHRRESTVATVNGAPITQAEFDHAAGSNDQALQSLIDQKLIQQEAKKEKVTVPDSEVNSELNTIKQQLGSPGEFAAALQRANLTEAQLKDQIRTKDLAQKMGAKGVSVSDDEAQAYYNQNKAQFGNQSFDQAKDQIKTQLLQQKQNEAIQTWIAGLRQKAKISVHMPA